MGRWKRRSSRVVTPSRASASALCGPTPLTNCTGEARSMAGIIPRRPAGPGSELEGGLARLDAHAADRVGQPDRRVDVVSLRMLLAPRGRGDHLLDDGDGHAYGGHVRGFELDRAEAVLVHQLARQLDGHLPGEERKRAPRRAGRHASLDLIDVDVALGLDAARAEANLDVAEPLRQLGRIAEVEVRVELALRHQHGLALACFLLVVPVLDDGELAAERVRFRPGQAGPAGCRARR